mmetsp:Transcript_36792/g.105449  ORF Transcript_36792/g.105449 Transcript_36792/m.105449 type:complete len:208 (-) Transcript_36792:115-738(-)
MVVDVVVRVIDGDAVAQRLAQKGWHSEIAPLVRQLLCRSLFAEGPGVAVSRKPPVLRWVGQLSVHAILSQRRQGLWRECDAGRGATVASLHLAHYCPWRTDLPVFVVAEDAHVLVDLHVPRVSMVPREDRTHRHAAAQVMALLQRHIGHALAVMAARPTGDARYIVFVTGRHERPPVAVSTELVARHEPVLLGLGLVWRHGLPPRVG